ncbi:MAG: fibronectin type III domain-containing protein, partial [Bacteroidales bacterium]
DNITLTTGTCAVPTALRMVTNTSNSVKLAWDGPSAANYKLEYKLAHSLDNYTSLIVQGNTTVDINGLLQNKSYIARIQTLCDETVLSGYSNQIVFQTQSSCFPPILQSSVNISSSVATINWSPAEGDTTTTLWEARLKKTNINEEWIYVRVNQVNFLNFSNLDRGTSYDVQLRAICDEWSESDWTPVLTFVSGCDVIELPYEQLFNGVNGDPMPDCWKGSDFTIQTGRATSTIATGINNVQHWLISPGFKIPEEGTITMEYTVQTTAMQDKYDIMISYRGTAEENFESIRNGETNSIVIPSERAGQVIYVAFVHKAPGAFNVDNIRISGCINKTIPSTLTVSELNPTSAKVSWRMQNNHQAAQYYIKCHVLTGLHAGETLLYYSDTTVATIDLYENSTYTISAGAVCQGNLFGFPTNEVNCTTGYICPAPVLLNLASTDITASGAAIRWNKKGEANVWYLQYRLNRNEADTLFCAPILIENDTFYVLDNLNEFTDYHVEVKISSYCGNGNYLVVPNTKEYYFHTPYRCPLPKNFKIENITGTSVDLRWTKGNQETEWTIQYGRIGFEPGTGSLINIEDTTYTKITGLTYGDSLDFYIKADCHDTLSSLWVGPLTALIADRYIMQKENTILVEACQGMLFDNGGATDNYKSNSLDTMIIIPQANSLAQLTGNYHVEGSSYDYITIYDGEGTTGTVLATLKGKGRIDALTSLSGSLTLCFKSDVSLEYTGFEFILNCTPIPTCSEPKNVTYNPANSILSWDQNRWGTADHYDVQVRLTTDTTHTTSYTVNGIEKELTSLLSNTAYEARVITYCGETEHSDWTPWFVFNTPCLSYAVPFIENFDEITAFPNCWSRNNNSTSVDTNHTLYFGSSNYPIAVTPPLNVTSARDLKVKFKAFMGTTLVSSGLSIGVME